MRLLSTSYSATSRKIRLMKIINAADKKSISQLDELFERDPLLKALSKLHDDANKALHDNDWELFNKISLELLSEEDEIIRINKIKTVLIVSKGAPEGHPIKECRDKILAEYNRIYAKLDRKGK